MLAAVLLQASFQVLPIFLRGTNDLVYLQAFGGFVILLIWLYVMANVLVLGPRSTGGSAAGARGAGGRGTLGLARAQALFERARDLLLELRLLGEERAEVLARQDEEAKRVFAVTVAVRVCPRAARSRRRSRPLSIVRISEPSFVTATSPSTMTKNSLPAAPSRVRDLPSSTSMSSVTFASSRSSPREVGEEGAAPECVGLRVLGEKSCTAKIYTAPPSFPNRWRSACAPARGGCSPRFRHRRAPPPSGRGRPE